MNPQPQPGQYSPDGRYRWDGTAWRPAQVVSTPPRSAAWRAPRFVAVLVAIAALLVGGLAGAAAGAGAGVAGSKPHGPTAPPTFAADFPNARQRYLPGVTVSAIAQTWLKEGNSWTCEPDDSHAGPTSGAKQRLECTAPGDLKYDVGVDIEYDDETHLRAVDADCSPILRPGNTYCRSLFANLGDALLAASQPDLRKQAQDWAGQNADSDNSTVIGGVRLSVKLTPHFIHATPAV